MDTPPTLPKLPPDPLSGPPLPPGEGALWLKAALRFFQVDSLRWIAIAALFFIILQAIGFVLGELGMIVVFLLKPILTVGFLAAAWHQERAVRPTLSHLFYGFKSNWKALLPLGLVYFFGLALALTLGTAVSGVSIEQLMDATQKPLTPETVGKIRSAMLWTVLFMLPVTLALWFAPALVVFDDLPFATALKRSLAACARTLAAIVVYGIVLFGFVMVLSLFVAATQAISPAFSRGLMFMLMLPITAVMFIADYVSYRRVFHPNQPLRLP